LQVCDSNFPSGAFSHSFGLETYIQEGKITNKKTFQLAVKQFIKTQFVYTDGLACRMGFEAIKNGRTNRLWEIDQELFALANARETREGNKRIGRQLVKVMNELYPCELLKQYESKIKVKEANGHSSLVFAMIVETLDIELDMVLSSYLFSTVSSIVQNGVRGIPLGQTDGQKILLELHPLLHEQVIKIINLSEDDFGASVPGLEIAQMRHEQLSVRLFSS